MKMLCNKLTYISPHIDNSLPPNILLVHLHVARKSGPLSHGLIHIFYARGQIWHKAKFIDL